VCQCTPHCEKDFAIGIDVVEGVTVDQRHLRRVGAAPTALQSPANPPPSTRMRLTLIPPLHASRKSLGVAARQTYSGFQIIVWQYRNRKRSRRPP
jgi:hypothetical protein